MNFSIISATLQVPELQFAKLVRKIYEILAIGIALMALVQALMMTGRRKRKRRRRKREEEEDLVDAAFGDLAWMMTEEGGARQDRGIN